MAKLTSSDHTVISVFRIHSSFNFRSSIVAIVPAHGRLVQEKTNQMPDLALSVDLVSTLGLVAKSWRLARTISSSLKLRSQARNYPLNLSSLSSLCRTYVQVVIGAYNNLYHPSILIPTIAQISTSDRKHVFIPKAREGLRRGTSKLPYTLLRTTSHHERARRADVYALRRKSTRSESPLQAEKLHRWRRCAVSYLSGPRASS